MNLKEHFKTTYSLEDLARKLINLFLTIFYKNPISVYFYNKELNKLKEKIKKENIKYIVNVTEGIGNQMFQYAFAKKLSEFGKVLLNKRTRRKLYRRKYLLDRLNIELDVTDLEIENNNFNFKTVKEDLPFLFDSKIIKNEPSCYFKGYFQSYKYFNDIKNELINNFKFKGDFTAEYTEMKNLIENSNSVLINFRVGIDYKKLGWMIDYSYQKEAVLKIKELLPNQKLKFFIFADNIKEVKKHFKIDDDIVFVDLGKNNKDKIFLDLELMKICKHDIITNSSYSFWGAYLNENEDKIVIAPEPWIFENSDIIPDNWIKLKALKKAP